MQDLATLNIEELTPLTPEVISRQATINIGAPAAIGLSPSLHARAVQYSIHNKATTPHQLTLEYSHARHGAYLM